MYRILLSLFLSIGFLSASAPRSLTSGTELPITDALKQEVDQNPKDRFMVIAYHDRSMHEGELSNASIKSKALEDAIAKEYKDKAVVFTIDVEGSNVTPEFLSHEGIPSKLPVYSVYYNGNYIVKNTSTIGDVRSALTE